MAKSKIGNEFLGAALDTWEAEDGPFTLEELDKAASTLGLPRRTRAASEQSSTQARDQRTST